MGPWCSGRFYPQSSWTLPITSGRAPSLAEVMQLEQGQGTSMRSVDSGALPRGVLGSSRESGCPHFCSMLPRGKYYNKEKAGRGLRMAGMVGRTCHCRQGSEPPLSEKGPAVQSPMEVREPSVDGWGQVCSRQRDRQCNGSKTQTNVVCLKNSKQEGQAGSRVRGAKQRPSPKTKRIWSGVRFNLQLHLEKGRKGNACRD